MHIIDYLIILMYFAGVIGVGFYFQRRASQSLSNYFLGGNRLSWPMLAMSGGVSNFDITGTMFITAQITYFGMNGMWYQWIWGFLMGAFFLAYMGKWIRRSNVLTGAEWMLTRFGANRAGYTARLAYTFMAVATAAAFIGYTFQGIGKFAYVYTGVDPTICASVIFSITTLYVLLGGLYSVVLTDVIQTIILSVAAVLIAAIAFMNVTPELLAEKLPADFTSLIPAWRLSEAKMAQLAGTHYEVYEMFGALTIVWVLKGLLLNFGGPAQLYDFQRFLAARNTTDAAKLGAGWSVFIVVRWAMIMGIALLFLTGFTESGDPEQVMPLVLQHYLPIGVRGIVIAGLLAAFMSTFSSTVNSGASYLVRDLWQPLFGSQKNERSLVRAGYVATIGLVLVGVLIGLNADSIRSIFDWIMGGLGAAFLIPNVLRWYWWRLNGWGYATGTLIGLGSALIVPFIEGLSPMYISFPIICIISAIGTILVTLLSAPTESTCLVAFYESIRPFGFWGPVRRQATLSKSDVPTDHASLLFLNVILAMGAILGMYLAPMYLVGHWYAQATTCLGIFIACTGTLYFTWFKKL